MVEVTIKLSNDVYERIIKDEYAGNAIGATNDLNELLDALDNGVVINRTEEVIDNGNT